MTDEWNKVESEMWNPEEGESVSGVYLGFQPEVGANKSNLYTIEDSSGKQMGVWGSKVLDGKMISAQVGQQVKIEFVGRVKPDKGQEYKSYEVYTKPVVN